MYYRIIPPLLVSALLLTGCKSEFDVPIDCSEQCGDDCAAEGFAFDRYQGCGAEAGADFCGLPSASASCVEVELDIEELSVEQIQRGLEDGDFSCEWLTNAFIERALWHDLRMRGDHPPLNSFVTMNEQALQTARRLDEYQRCEGRLSGPLHCAPFVIKTNYASAEVPVTNGSWALQEAQPDFDAHTVERLRRAGAIMLGSTTMDEFARGAHSLSGRSGKTGNAYNTRYNSGGSSAGSAVAVSANFAVAGLGTDNCSSLTVPAGYNGLTTIRSSHRLVSTRGIFPSNQLDAVAGPMTRNVRDLALFFDEMARFDPFEMSHCEQDMPRQDSYVAALREDGLEGKRIGVLRTLPQGDRDLYRGNQEVEGLYARFLEELEELGAQVVEDISLPGLPLERQSSGMGQEINRFLANTTGGAADVDGICESGLYSKSTFDSKSDCLNFNSRSDRNLRSRIDAGMEQYESNRAYVEGVLREYSLDALVYPVDARGPAGITGLSSNCILASVTGLPTIVVNAGRTAAGLPIGMSFTAAMYEESTLFEIAYGYEQATLYRRAPVLGGVDGAPPLTVAEFNEVSDALGRAAFDQVLVDQDRFALSAQVFAQITRQVLEEFALQELLPR